MKTKKFILPLFITTSLLSACGGAGIEKANALREVEELKSFNELVNDMQVSEDIISDKEEVMVANHNMGVLVGEEVAIEAIEGERKPVSNLKYESLNPEIATVNEEGIVTGLKAGVASIRVYNDDRNEETFVNVNVTSLLTKSAATTLVEKIAAEATVPDEVVNRAFYRYSFYKNDVLQLAYSFDRQQAASIPEAYFSMDEIDMEMRVEGGNKIFGKNFWLFYTNQYYDTYIFHHEGALKNYLPISTVKFKDEGYERTEPMCAVLDNFFTSGRDFFTGIFDDLDISDLTDFVSGDYNNVIDQYAGKLDDKSMMIGYTLVMENETASQTMERNYGIPAGTKTPCRQISRSMIKDDVIVSHHHHIIYDYEIDGDSWQFILDINDEYELFDEQKSQLVYPDREQFTKVDSLFDL